jgi:hypothetical protein
VDCDVECGTAVALLSLNEPFIQEASLYELDAFLGRSDMAAPWLSIAATLAGMHLHQPQLALSGEQGRDSCGRRWYHRVL